jgi:hypothetical protein
VDGRNVEFRFKVMEYSAVYKGTIENDDEMKGTAEYADGQATGTWTAKRKK